MGWRRGVRARSSRNIALDALNPRPELPRHGSQIVGEQVLMHRRKGKGLGEEEKDGAYTERKGEISAKSEGLPLPGVIDINAIAVTP